MNISFFITTLGGGGAERVLTNLANYLVEKGHSIEIVVLRSGQIKYEIDSRVNIIFLDDGSRCRKLLKHLHEVRQSREYLLSKNENDCVISFLELPMLLSLAFKKKMRCKLIVSERSNPLYYSKLYRFFLYHLINRADGAVFQTEKSKSWYKNYYGEYAVIPNAINEKFMIANASSLKGNRIVSVGRIDNNKNHLLLIDSFMEICSRFPTYKLEIYGKGPLESKLSRYVELNGLSDRILFKGFCHDIISELADASIFVLTSEYEGMPNSLMEAMALGIPSISTDCFGNDGEYRLIDSRENAIIVPQNDKEALAKAISELITDKYFSMKLAKKAIEVRNTFSPSKIYEMWGNFIKRICLK